VLKEIKLNQKRYFDDFHFSHLRCKTNDMLRTIAKNNIKDCSDCNLLEKKNPPKNPIKKIIASSIHPNILLFVILILSPCKNYLC